LGKRIEADTNVRFSYRLEEVKVNGVDAGAPQDVYDVKGTSILSGLSVNLTLDTRDDFITPTRGYSVEINYELVGLFLGGDHDFSQANIRLAWFQTLYTTESNYKHVLNLGMRIGLADDHSPSKFVPIFERFFAGGATSIRGFEYRSVGPKVGDDPIGGNFMLLGTAEYGFPVYKDTLRGVLFVDAGNVIPQVDDTILDEMRVSVGFGFRVKVPMLGPRPFAFDFGFPIRKEHGDDVQIFSFSFGKSF
jgi:outer membrane protein insertion porin family